MTLYIPYWQFLLIPSLIYGIGWTLNAVVIAINHGMPVLAYGALTCDTAVFDKAVHICMTPQTRLRFLADWIYTMGLMASPGDYLEWLGERLLWPSFIIWAVLMIRDRREMSRWTI